MKKIMKILGKQSGIFDLNNSDKSVGSFLSRSDLKVIFGNEVDLSLVPFDNEIVAKEEILKLWHRDKIPNSPPYRKGRNKISFDEYILQAIIVKTYPNASVEQQVPVRVGKSNFTMDFKITISNNKSVFIEYDGPDHFMNARYGKPKHEPFEKKKKVEDKTGIEVINWAYWIQLCTTNVRAIFESNTKGFGALWSTNCLFGDFVFDNSAEIIDVITKRFNAVDADGYGYFYESNSRNRTKPEHPILQAIITGKEKQSRLIPQGCQHKEYWLPKIVTNIMQDLQSSKSRETNRK
ncbi:MAG: hypothetical protein LBR17_08875 [Bacteroidales bacterium]|jgi:hypothetical protein|nr:hypothetical protein [Bacteroidales bacterium]